MSDISTSGMPGETFSQISSDTAANLTAANIVGSDGNSRPVGALITCETKDIKFCLGGATPACAGAGHVLAAGGSLVLDSGSAVKTFKFVSSASGQAGTIRVTPFFEAGKV